MKPILIRFADDSYIHSGHFMLFLGGLAAVILLALEMRRTGEKPEEIYPLLFLLLFSTILGARLLYCLDFNDKFKYSLVDILKFWKGGLALHGGALLALAAYVLYVRWRELDIWRTGDLFTPPAALFITLARVGCILTGCCYGKQCDPDFPLAVTFTEYSSLAPKGVTLYPTQGLFTAAALAVFVFAWWKRKRKAFEGEVALLGVSLFSLLAFVIEFFRADLRVIYEVGGVALSQNQIIGAVVFLGLTGLYFCKRVGSASSEE